MLRARSFMPVTLPPENEKAGTLFSRVARLGSSLSEFTLFYLAFLHRNGRRTAAIRASGASRLLPLDVDDLLVLDYRLNSAVTVLDDLPKPLNYYSFVLRQLHPIHY